MNAKVLKPCPALRDNEGIIPRPTESISTVAPEVWEVPFGIGHGVEHVLGQDFVSQRGKLWLGLAADARRHEHFTLLVRANTDFKGSCNS